MLNRFLAAQSSECTSKRVSFSSLQTMVLSANSSVDPTQSSSQSHQDLLNRFNLVKQQVEQASLGRQVRLVAVSKRKPASDILTLYRSTGHLHFGENYVNELQEKANQLPHELKWHFIGSLQSNKCKILGAIPNLFAVETVDSLHKAQLLEKARAQFASTSKASRLEIYLQVNTSQEESKAGFMISNDEKITDTELYSTAKYIKEDCQWLNLAGLMTIGSITESKCNDKTNRDFERLKELKDQLSFSLDGSIIQLSMGMSADFSLAIKMGSNNVRVGSSIFGERPPLKKPT